MSKYTTLENIKRKARAKLRIGLGIVDPYSENQITQEPIDNDLIDQLIEEEEATIDSVLSSIYVLPLNYKHAILTKITDLLVLSSLYNHSFNSDSQNLSASYKQEGYSLLQSLVAGYNVYIPNMPPNIAPIGVRTAKALLPGETLKAITDEVPRVFVAELDTHPAYLRTDFIHTEYSNRMINQESYDYINNW